MANLTKKWHIKNRFHVKCKTLTNRKNYCKVRILSEDPEHKDLKLYEEWKVEKILLKLIPFKFTNCLQKIIYEYFSVLISTPLGGVVNRKNILARVS